MPHRPGHVPFDVGIGLKEKKQALSDKIRRSRGRPLVARPQPSDKPTPDVRGGQAAPDAAPIPIARPTPVTGPVREPALDIPGVFPSQTFKGTADPRITEEPVLPLEAQPEAEAIPLIEGQIQGVAKPGLLSPPPLPPTQLEVATALTSILPALARVEGVEAYSDENAFATDVLRTFEALLSTEAGQDNFLEDVYQKGQNADTEFILDLLGFSQSDINEFFIGAPPGQGSALEGILNRIFPERNIDATLEWATNEDPEIREAFWEEIKSQGVTTDTWALAKTAFPDLPTETLVEFFAHPTQPTNEFLSAIGDKVSGALQFTDGWWRVGLMELGFAFEDAGAPLRWLLGREEFQVNNAELLMNKAFKEHGWKAIFSGDVNDAWDVYFTERHVQGPAKFVAEMANPVYFLPIGGTAAAIARPFLRVPALGPTMQGIARTVQFAEVAPFRALGLAGRGLGVAARPVRAGLEEVSFQAEKLLLNRFPGGIRGGTGDNVSRFLLRELPTRDMMRAWMFQDDVFKSIAKKVPFLGSVAPATQIGVLPAQLATEREITQAITQEALIRQGTLAIGQGQKTNALAALRDLGTTSRIYGVNKLGIASTRRVTARNAGDSLALGDIVQAPERYIFEHPNGLAYAKRAQRLTDDAFQLAKSQGVDVKTLQLEEFQEFVHWVVTGRVDDAGELIVSRTGKGSAAVGGKASSFQHRRFETMMEGIKAGFRYDNNLETYVATYVDDMYKAISDKRLSDGLAEVVSRVEGILPVDPIGRLNALYPGVEKTWTGVRKNMEDLAYTLGNVQVARKGGVLTGSTMSAIRRRSPATAAQLDAVYALSETTVDKELARFSKEVWKGLNITPAQFKETISSLRGVKIDAQHPVRAGEIDNALKFIQADARTNFGMVKQIYANTHAHRNRVLKNITDDLFGQIAELRPAWDRARSERATKAALAREPRIGQHEGRINIISGGRVVRPHPMFSNQVYPEAIADQATKILSNDVNEFLKLASNISGTGVILQAALDLSAPGIQGLIPILAHPIVSSRAIVRMLEAFIDPRAWDRYITRRVATRNDRLFNMGSSAAPDFFESMGWLIKVAGKVPGGQWVMGQTYGRGQIAFSMFSEVYRDIMWELGSKQWKMAGQGAEYAKMLDRSVGITSFAQLGTPANLTAFTRGFISFAPQYRVATASYLANVFKGGMTGAAVRRDLAKAVGVGIGMYLGWTQGLGKPAYLNPFTDGKKFLSIQIGEHWFGVGSAVISMMRMFADITSSIVSIGENEPMDFLTMDKWQNPIIRGFLTQSAPLTRIGIEAATQRDFLGYPLESPEDWAGWAAENISPIMAQDIFFDKSGVPQTPLSVLGNVVGLRTSPETRWEALDRELHNVRVWEMIDDLTEEQIDKINDGDTIMSVLNRFQKVEMFEDLEESNPDIIKRYDDSIADALLRSGSDYRDYVASLENFKDQVRDGLIASLDVGVVQEGLSTLHLRDQYGIIMNEYGAKLEGIGDEPRYQDLLAGWAESREERIPDAEVFDQAFWDYMEKVVSPDRDIPGVGFDFEGYNTAIDVFEQRWGRTIHDQVRFVLEKGKEETGYPEWSIRLWKDRKDLNDVGYWALPSKATASFTQTDLDNGIVPEALIPVVEQLLAADLTFRRDKRELDDRLIAARLATNAIRGRGGSKTAIEASERREDAIKSQIAALKAEVADDPSLSVDARLELRKGNPALDAVLGFWHYGGKVQSQEAVDIMVRTGEELGVPFEAMGGGLPPLDLVPFQFEYDVIEDSDDRLRYRTDNPVWDDFLVEDMGFTPVGDRVATLIPPELVEADGEYNALPTTGKDRLRFRHFNPTYEAFLVKVRGFTPVGDRWKAGSSSSSSSSSASAPRVTPTPDRGDAGVPELEDPFA